MKNFPKRNRIISAISDIVLVVEAYYRSGSRITARIAKDLNKIVCAIPSNITSKSGLGSNLMIKEGANIIIEENQILELFENKKNIQEIPKEYEQIYNILSDKKMHINEISKKLKMDISVLNSKITLMEIEGFVEQVQTNYFKQKN